MSRRQRGPRMRSAFLGSVALHVAAVAAVTLGALRADPAPRQVRVYRVDIVSPAPNVLGEPPAEPPAPSEPGPAPDAAPAPEPPAPEPPAPEPPAPEPAPPPRETPKQPAPPRERPKQPPPREPERPARPAAESRPKTEAPPRNNPRPPASTTTPGTGSGTTRSAGTGTTPGPATGRNPDASSPGGEGLNIRTRGIACPENYCNNIVRQVRRFFRAPEGTQGASGNVCFTLFRDGSVDNVTVERQSGGGFRFRLALVEAVEQAGLQGAFGALPSGFGAESIQLCVLMSPATT